MSDLNKFKQIVDDVLEIIWGKEVKPKRARTKSGRYKKDNKATKDVNEAWVGGKAPKKTRKKK
tara:strand:- start:513 stop:701 length:189 start_codon:yes stop_codon:yes gene_type:complete